MMSHQPGATGDARCASCGQTFTEERWRALHLVQTFAPQEVARHVLGWPLDQSIQVRRCSACRGAIPRRRSQSG